MKSIKHIIMGLVLTGAAVSAAAQPATAELWRDMNAPIHERVTNLLSKMTVEEKVSLMTNNAPAIPRLGIDRYYLGNEALHGIIRPGKFTVFPQAIAFAATWNPDLMLRVSTAISDEARGKWNLLEHGKKQHDGGSDLLSFWSPTVNMARDPRWGRTPETYGEDPYLTGQIGLAFVRGLQGNNPRYIKCIATPKHFAANNEEHNRASCNAEISERDLRDYYFPAFERLIVDGKAQSIMTAYNAVNGIPCTVNSWLVRKVLRGDWGFKGYITTDCSAPEWMVTQHRFVRDFETAAVLMMQTGIDVECADKVYTQPLLDAYKHYRVTDAQIDSAAYHLLRARMMLGMYDDPKLNPYNQISPSVVGCKEHMELARETSRQSIVLLKNQKGMLPLNPKKLRSIAVVGNNADHCVFGDYTGTPANDPVSVLDGIKNRLRGTGVEVKTAPWVSASQAYEPITSQYFPGGVKAEYFSNKDLQGTPRARMEEDVHYDPASKPDPFQPKAPMSCRWTGKLRPNVTGTYTLTLRTDDGCRLWIDGKKLIDSWVDRAVTADNVEITLEAGREYDFRLDYYDGGGESFERMYWRVPNPKATDRLSLFGDAGKVVKSSDAVIAVMGINPSIEHEGQDRYTINLPADQQEFIKEIYKANPNTVLVIVGGSSLAINWPNEHLPAIIDAWYPGEQGGNAVADVLFGDYNPAGRLPLTFYKDISDLPDFHDYSISTGMGRTYRYFKGTPLYEFGYGLSYTKFTYSNLKVSQDADTVHVRFAVKNTGHRDGDEVAQVYVHYPATGTYMPIKQLQGFKRTRIAKGKTEKFDIAIPKKELRYWNEKKGQFETPAGTYEIMVGASSADIRLSGSLAL